MITREKLEYAARNYNGDKYSEEFYTYHLGVLQNAQDISESVSRAVEYLFLWKLGKVRSRKTPSSSQLKFSDSKGHRYYSIPTTETHDKVIKKAVEKGKLEIAIAFRNGAVTYDEVKSYASNLTSSTIVLPAFYVHVWHPVEYPILDKKVWKVFLDQRGKPVSLYTKPTSWSDFEAYTSFFRKLVDDTGLDWRTVDRGLWVLGDVCQTITNGKTAPRNLYKSSGLHLIKVGNLTGRGIEWDAVERQYVDKEFAERHPTAVLKKGDILFTAVAHGPKWIGLKVDIYEGAPKHISKPVLACGEIMICRLNRKLKIDPYFVLLYLRSGAGYQAIQQCIRGQSGHVYPIDVAKIRIPKPSQFNSTELKKALSTLKKSLRARRSSADADSDSKRVAENLFPSELKKPIIAT